MNKKNKQMKKLVKIHEGGEDKIIAKLYLVKPRKKKKRALFF
jgi:hypothetical protein